jgi:hypothetical protein
VRRLCYGMLMTYEAIWYPVMRSCAMYPIGPSYRQLLVDEISYHWDSVKLTDEHNYAQPRDFQRWMTINLWQWWHTLSYVEIYPILYTDFLWQSMRLAMVCRDADIRFTGCLDVPCTILNTIHKTISSTELQCGVQYRLQYRIQSHIWFNDILPRILAHKILIYSWRSRATHLRCQFRTANWLPSQLIPIYIAYKGNWD